MFDISPITGYPKREITSSEVQLANDLLSLKVSFKWEGHLVLGLRRNDSWDLMMPFADIQVLRGQLLKTILSDDGQKNAAGTMAAIRFF
jgi:hypothetical protein